jgi:hypothetical protein
MKDGIESKTVSFYANRRVWRCQACKRQFSIKVGTIFEDSPLPIDKWLVAMWLIANAKNGISSHEVGRALGVTQKTAWFMIHRIRLAMKMGSIEKSQMSGEVEADETFIGGKAINMHKDKRQAKFGGKGRGRVGKAVVMGLLERHESDFQKSGHSEVHVTVVPNTSKPVLQGEIYRHVKTGSQIMTDANPSYIGLDYDYIHQSVDHAREYAVRNVHTNGLENFWCLLKRCYKGTYTHWNDEHLFRYLDEQSFRFNARKLTDADRFLLVCGKVSGKRMTYKQLTGKA